MSEADDDESGRVCVGNRVEPISEGHWEGNR